jgi:hypothetical protein
MISNTTRIKNHMFIKNRRIPYLIYTYSVL